jgi:GDPmannose 4,6-dehydratase
MLQQDEARDYVIGTGMTHSVRNLLEVAFSRAGLDYREYVELDPALLRPAEVFHLRADPSKARRDLGWKPEVSFEQLIHMMVDEDLARVRNQLIQVSNR